MKLFLFFFFSLLACCSPAAAQEFINMPYNKAETALKKAYPGKSGQPAVYTRKDSILVQVSDLTQLIYVFDKKGLCMTETTSTRCDSCYNGYLEVLLNKKIYNWKKINENQYISRYEDNMMIELVPEAEISTFSIFRADFTREVYELLLKD